MDAAKDSLLLRALSLQQSEQTPIWLMRQAGRYLPEYRRIRESVKDFMELCKNTEYAVELSLQPIRRYGFDAAIVFSDILTVPEAMGMELSFVPGRGPVFATPLGQDVPLDSLRPVQPQEELHYVLDAVRGLRSELAPNIPLIGFSGSPWTLAVYMFQGHGDGQFASVRAMLHQQPQRVQQLLDLLVDTVAAYLKAQYEAGADALMIFDTWGGLLGAEHYRKYSLEPIKRIIALLPQQCPVIVFGRNNGPWLEEIAASGCSGIGVDWTVDIKAACERVGGKVAVQGNMDPAVLLTDANTIKRETKRILDAVAATPGYIFNIGHGITPQVPPDNVSVLVDAVREYGMSKP
ncbi:MAG: uroporphyrinogen decarboxylase [Candidatus Porifericomitaceae bacterium WSBS_2022_MAG_OTU9]